MRSTVVGAAAALLLLAGCGGVDRDGTRDLIVKQFEEAGFDVDAACIDDALGDYSDDELEKLDKALGDDPTAPEAQELLVSIAKCANP